jgi:uncharacterized protein (TIGR00369 family)
MKPVARPYGAQGCFFCGTSNPVGLKLTFEETETEPKELVCTWVPSQLYTGFGNILHGGIQSGLFDEIMGWTTLHLSRQVAVTVSLNIEFIKPLYVEQRIEARCRIQSRNGSKINLEAEIRNSKEEICTKAVGTYVLMDSERFRAVVGEE